MSEPTPGPWRVGTSKSVVADSDIGTYSSEDHRKHYGGALIAESICTDANARLISAAPDLLAACQEVRERMIEGPVILWDLLDDAIAKATNSE